MPKREGMPAGSMHKLAQVAAEYTDPRMFKALFEGTPTPKEKPKQIIFIGQHNACIRHAHENDLRGAFQMKIVGGMESMGGFDPAVWRVILCEGWRDAIGFSGRADLRARGFEIEVAE